jgi:hypothetical protein
MGQLWRTDSGRPLANMMPVWLVIYLSRAVPSDHGILPLPWRNPEMDDPFQREHRDYRVFLVTVLIVAGVTALLISRLGHIAWSDDEAVFILTAQAVRQGATLYDEVWYNYPPGFLQLLNAAFTLGSVSLSTARITVLFCTVLALVLVAGLGRSVSSTWGGVLALVLLVTAPHFLSLSSSVMTEVPALGLATGAVWAALCYHRTRRRKWLVLSSLVISASLWIKPTTIPTLAVPLAAVWVTERTNRHRLASAALCIALTVVPFTVGLLFNNPIGFLRQFGLTYVRSRTVFELDLLGNITDLAGYFVDDDYRLTHVSLLILGGFGWYTLWRHRSTEALLLGVWFVPAVIMLLFHTPLYRHHLIQLLFPVCVLASLGLRRVAVTLRGSLKPVQLGVRCALLVLTAVELGLSLWVSMVTLPHHESSRMESTKEAVQHIRETTRSDEYIITDGHFIALRAGRPVPAELTNTSRMRIQTGQLTSQQLIDISRRVQPGAIVFWEKKLDSLREFTTWVTCQYDVTGRIGGRDRIYQPQRFVVWEDVAVPVNVYFGRAILLLGYSVKSQSVEAGSGMEVTLYWKATSGPEGDFTVFLRLVDSQGAVVKERDGIPHDGQCPTRIWQPGEVIRDAHAVYVDERGAGGPYRLAVSVGDGEGHRLSPFDNVGSSFPGDEVVLSRTTVDTKRRSGAPAPQHIQTSILGDAVEFLGYDMVEGPVGAGESIELTLYWRCLRAMMTSYTVFSHVIGNDGEIWGQQDSIPVGGRRPTVGWLVDETITDHHTILLQRDVPSGHYRVALGMYDVSTGQRLPVVDATSRGIEFDRVVLNTLIRAGQP